MSWSDGYNHWLPQRDNGNYEDSEDSKSSQETRSSQSTQETDSSQELTERLNPWSRILDEDQEPHEVQLSALVDEYKRNGESENVSHLKRRTLSFLSTEKNREILFEYFQWMRAMKKDWLVWIDRTSHW